MGAPGGVSPVHDGGGRPVVVGDLQGEALRGGGVPRIHADRPHTDRPAGDQEARGVDEVAHLAEQPATLPGVEVPVVGREPAREHPVDDLEGAPAGSAARRSRTEGRTAG